MKKLLLILSLFVLTACNSDTNTFTKKQECLEYKDEVMYKIRKHHAITGATTNLEKLFFSPKQNSCLYYWSSVEDRARFYFIGDVLTGEPFLEAVYGCFEPDQECANTIEKAHEEFENILKNYE